MSGLRFMVVAAAVLAAAFPAGAAARASDRRATQVCPGRGELAFNGHSVLNTAELCAALAP
jgi:hypothetical protein